MLLQEFYTLSIYLTMHFGKIFSIQITEKVFECGMC